MGRGLTRSRSKSRMTATEKRSNNRKRSLSRLHAKLATSDGVNYAESDDEYSEEPYEIETEGIENVDVVDRYKLAAKFAQEALELVVAGCSVGASVAELCKMGDAHIEQKCSEVFRKPDEDGMEVFKGVAFPTSVSINDQAAHNAPHENEPANEASTLSDGDLVKVHMGCHIDGYFSQVAHTLIVGDPAKAHPQAADCLNAAYTAAEAAMRIMRPDLQNSNDAVTNMYERVSNEYNVTTCEGVLSHRVLRWNPIGPACVISVKITDRDEQFQEVEPVYFGGNQVWHIDVAFSSGHEKLHCAEEPTTIWKRNDIMLAPRVRAAHYVLKSVREKLLCFPFSTREFDDVGKAKLGLKELQRQDMVDPIPVMKTKKNDVVARFCWTVMLTPNAVVPITGLPFPSSTPQVAPKDESLQAILSASLLAPTHRLRKKKVKNAAKRARTQAMDAD